MSWLSKVFGGRTRRVASSSMEPIHLSACANAFAFHAEALLGPGFSVHRVSNTNSMIPTIDNNCLVVVEACAFEDFTEGDIALYRGNPNVWKQTGLMICHRLNERSKSGWMALGDGNTRQDLEPVTPANFVGRVVAICYGRRRSDTDN